MFSVKKKRSSFCHNLSNMREVTPEYDAKAERLASQLIEGEEMKKKVAGLQKPGHQFPILNFLV